MEIKLNEELIKRCNNQSMYNRGDHIQDDANTMYNGFIAEFENDSYSMPEYVTYQNRRISYKLFLEKSFNEYLGIASRFIPVTIAGPSNYPTKQQQKIIDRMSSKQQEILEKSDKFFKNTRKLLQNSLAPEEAIQKYRNGYNEPISSDDPHAKEKLEAKLEYLTEKHQQYKDYNKKARNEGKQQLPPYVLANSNQNIKSVKDRLETIDRMNKIDEVGYYFAGGEVKFDKVDSRVKIFFDTKPDENIRSELKSHAYRWSPINECWQRKLTPDAIRTTKNMFKDIGSLEIKKVKDNTKEITM